MSDIKKIVIRSPNWLGDSIFSIPAVRGVRSLFPDAAITILAPENLAPLWRDEKAVDEVMEFGRPTTLKEKLQIMRRLREGRYDLGVLFPNSFESALWFFGGRVRRRLGYRTCGRGILLSLKPRPVKRGHQVHRYLGLVQSLGSVSVSPVPSVTVAGEAQCRADETLKGAGIGEGAPLVGINPGSTYGSAKNWPPERFAGLIGMLRQEGMSVVVVGGEISLAASVCSGKAAGVLNMAGRTTVAELAAIIERCTVFVSNDTGPLHLACAVGTPVVAIMGPTDLDSTGPLGPGIVLEKRVECAPCLKRECPEDHRCMTEISVEEVHQAVRELLGKSQIPSTKFQTIPKSQ